jgi:peptidoglycan lytic transglycosylase
MRSRLFRLGWWRIGPRWAVVGALVLTACATVSPVLRDREVGMASWYGEPFHGRFTANGERYDMHAYTAAHRLYPFGTRLRVTNLENGRSVTVRVNDRGPFVRGRIIDLSLAAATDLGMVPNGTARVRLERVSVSASMAAEEAAYTVQVGAFVEETAARALERRLSARYPDVLVSSVRVNGATYYRVRVGRVATITDAERLARRLDGDGFTPFVTRQDPEPPVQ